MVCNSLIHQDCRLHRGDRPCAPHKRDGRECSQCDLYDRIRTRVLIIKLDALGDVLRTTSLLPALRDTYPGLHVTWITSTGGRALLADNPLVDRILTVEDNAWSYLSREHFHIGINPDADERSTTMLALARCDKKFGLLADDHAMIVPLNDAADRWWRMGLNDRLKRENRRTYSQLLYSICELDREVSRPQFVLQAQHQERVRKRLAAGVSSDGRWIALNTGASTRWQYKRWSVHAYRRLVELLTQSSLNLLLALVGGPEEAEFNQAILSGAPPGLFDAGTANSIGEFAALLSHMHLVITPDSLGFHLASALGIPSICLVGPTSPWELDVFDGSRVLIGDVECIGCYHERCDRVRTCMGTLTAERVFDEACAVLQGHARTALAT